MALLLAYIVLALCTGCVSAQADVHPPSNPTKVYCRMYITSISKIDGVEQLFDSDFYLTLFWVDNRLMSNQTIDDQNAWRPLAEFTNSKGDVERSSNPFEVSNKPPAPNVGTPGDVWVRSDQRYVGQFFTKLHLHDFPFDQQLVKVNLESSLYPKEEVVFIPLQNLSFLTTGFEITEWDIDEQKIAHSDVFYPPFDQNYSRLSWCVVVTRQHSYYMTKVVAGVILLVYMCIAVFSLDVEEADRQMGTLTVFLAIVAFLFVSSDSIPKVAYSTRIEVFMLFSFFLVFLIMIIHAVLYVLDKLQSTKDQQEKNQLQASAFTSMVSVPEADPPPKRKRSRSSIVKEKYQRAKMVRRIDLMLVVTLSIMYGIGIVIIFLRPVDTGEACK